MNKGIQAERLREIALKALFACVVLLVAGWNSQLAAQDEPVPKPCDAKPDWILQVSKPDAGWDTGFVDKAHKLGRDGPILTSKPDLEGVVVSEYPKRRKYFIWTEVVAYSCDHSATLRTERILIAHIYGYAKKGKTFAYAVLGNCGKLEQGAWHAAGCDVGVLLMDTTGTGRFDLLRIGRESPISTPDWVNR